MALVHGTYVDSGPAGGIGTRGEFSGPRYKRARIYTKCRDEGGADPHESGEWSASNTKRTTVRPADDGGVPYIRYDRVHGRDGNRRHGWTKV